MIAGVITVMIIGVIMGMTTGMITPTGVITDVTMGKKFLCMITVRGCDHTLKFIPKLHVTQMMVLEKF